MTTVYYKECHGCGKLVRFSSPEVRSDWTKPCPFCGEMLADTAFTTEVELSDPASVAAAKKEEEKHSYQIFSEYLQGDSAKEQKYLDRFKEEQKKAEQRQESPSDKEAPIEKKNHSVLWRILETLIFIGYFFVICKEQGVKTAFEGIIGVALFIGAALAICFIKELLDAAPPRHRGGSDSGHSNDDWIVRYTVYHELMKNSHCDCHHSSSHDCGSHHSSSHSCDCHHH